MGVEIEGEVARDGVRRMVGGFSFADAFEEVIFQDDINVLPGNEGFPLLSGGGVGDLIHQCFDLFIKKYSELCCFLCGLLRLNG